jgi:hypothetical protein
MGIGNRGIAERIIEALTYREICANDTVIVQWTESHRIDSHKDSPENTVTSWGSHGNIFLNLEHYPKKWIEDFWCEKSFVMHTLNYISMSIYALKEKGCKIYFMSMTDLSEHIDRFPEFSEYNKHISKVHWFPPMQDWYEKTEYQKRSFKDTLSAKKINWTKKIDHHPGPKAHCEYLNTHVRDFLNIEIDQDWADKAEAILDTIDDYKDIRHEYINSLQWDCYKETVRGL